MTAHEPPLSETARAALRRVDAAAATYRDRGRWNPRRVLSVVYAANAALCVANGCAYGVWWVFAPSAVLWVVSAVFMWWASRVAR